MQAVGYTRVCWRSARADALIDIELPEPVPGRARPAGRGAGRVGQPGRREDANAPGAAGAGEYQVLGWDVSGVVLDTGSGCSHYAGRRRSVYYAGSIARAGRQRRTARGRRAHRRPEARQHRVRGGCRTTADIDHRLGVAVRPACASRRRVPGAADALVVVGGAGGVGSMAVQLARALSDIEVIATASRDSTARVGARELGAHHVINHRAPLRAADRGASVPAHRGWYCRPRTATSTSTLTWSSCWRRRGASRMIDDPEPPFDPTALKRKSLSLALGVDVHALAVRDRGHGHAARPADARRR